MSIPRNLREKNGKSGNGTLTQTGGTIRVGQLQAGYNSGSVGLVSISRSSNLSASSIVVGQFGTGTMLQGGGAVNAGTPGVSGLVIGYFAGGSSYNQSNGTLSDSGTVVGYSSLGTLIQSGGTHTSSIITVGQKSGGYGSSYILNGGGILSASAEYLSGTVLKSDQSSNTTPALTVGECAAGTYNLTGGTLSGGIEDVVVREFSSFWLSPFPNSAMLPGPTDGKAFWSLS